MLGNKIIFGPGDFSKDGRIPFMRRIGKDNDEQMRLASVMISYGLHLLSENGRSVYLETKVKTVSICGDLDKPPDKVVVGEKVTIEIEL